MKTFGGTVLYLDRSDINTDEIIPAKYLTEVTKEALKPYLLEDLKLPGFDAEKIASAGYRVIVGRANFGCGSSREHAPWALELNGITMAIAENFARIFRQNMFNCGMLAIELPAATIERIFAFGKGPDVTCELDIRGHKLIFNRPGAQSLAVNFTLNPFDEALVEAGGWLEFADAKY